jgi:hypothetical protein
MIVCWSLGWPILECRPTSDCRSNPCRKANASITNPGEPLRDAVASRAEESSLLGRQKQLGRKISMRLGLVRAEPFLLPGRYSLRSESLVSGGAFSVGLLSI